MVSELGCLLGPCGRVLVLIPGGLDYCCCGILPRSSFGMLERF